MSSSPAEATGLLSTTEQAALNGGELVGVRSDRVVLETGVEARTLLFRNGKLDQILEQSPPGAPVVDFGRRVIMPGLVDCHVHINEPGRTEWEGFETATQAAAAGGVTTVVDMPLNSLPVTTTRAALDRKIEACEGRRYVDVGFWGGVIPGNQGELGELARGGVLGCKAFLVHSGIDEFPNVLEADLLKAMPMLRDQGLPLLVHAELDLGATLGDQDPRTYQNYLNSRPHEWEDAAIELMIRLCRKTGCAVHIVHLSSSHSLPALRTAKQEGLPITVETCPHYLCFNAEAIPDGATHFKCAPPIREGKNREALWAGLLDGTIDFVITDHSPCIPSLKLPETGDFLGAWGGIASLQLGLPAIWTEAHKRGASLLQLSDWMCRAPAQFAGLGHQKGRIARGFDADLVIWEPESEIIPMEKELFFRHKVSPYIGRSLLGKVHCSISRGQVNFNGARHCAGATGQLLLTRN